MSKSKHTKYYDVDEDEASSLKAKDEYRNRRKQKKLKNALRAKNIDDLVRYDEET